MSGTVLKALHALSHLIYNNLMSDVLLSSPFSDMKTEAKQTNKQTNA